MAAQLYVHLLAAFAETSKSYRVTLVCLDSDALNIRYPHHVSYLKLVTEGACSNASDAAAQAQPDLLRSVVEHKANMCKTVGS